MQKLYKQVVYIFRRDLRLVDNTALHAACKNAEKVIPIFMFDPRQVGADNEYRSANAIQFMIESLQDLEQQLEQKGGKLFLFHGQVEQVLDDLLAKYHIDAVYINKDYTPFSLNRDEQLKHICGTHEVQFHAYDDALLNNPEQIKTQNGDPYSVYTPYAKAARKLLVSQPKRMSYDNFYAGTLKGAEGKGIYKKILICKNNNIWVHGGTNEAQKLLRKIKQLTDYKNTRDYPAQETTNLSAHNKFGTVSIRQVYHKIVDTLGSHHALIGQLYWRDFFYQVAYHSPFVFGQPYRDKYKKLQWSRSKKNFERWCEGQTGFPIVDAGMRQLNATGYMHNRARMIVSSFLTKDLHINWLWGEKYFAQQLVDYDPCVNNGSWQWAASTGTDAQPYFRIFNPWLQQKKYDPDAEYIKEWVPELADVDAKVIHNWHKDSSPAIDGYPRPMVDHDKERKVALKMYKGV